MEAVFAQYVYGMKETVCNHDGIEDGAHIIHADGCEEASTKPHDKAALPQTSIVHINSGSNNNPVGKGT